MNAPIPAEPAAAAALAERYTAVRAHTLALAAPLSEADAQVQSMPDASPAKWHLAHVTWFFETFVLERFEPGFRPYEPAFRVLYNSYYNGIGDQYPRPRRGLISRPSLDAIRAWRADVDARMVGLLAQAPAGVIALVELGLQHEQQHQELLLTDLLHAFSFNPMSPAYRPLDVAEPAYRTAAEDGAWLDVEGGVVELGHRGEGFAFDNETPRHTAWLRPYALAMRPVTQHDWAAFVDDGGYRDPRWWMSAGWDAVRAQGWVAPMHWRRGEAGWRVFTLRGERPLHAGAPVAHVSWYEADAYARWLGAQHPGSAAPRLPTEAEWEHAVAASGPLAFDDGGFADGGALRPMPPTGAHSGLRQAFGEVWQWTRSDYAPYPGFRAWEGAVGEYNAKFMAGQYVLRGASCATPRSHARTSYRNFFPPDARWQFAGVRLARDLD
jgi:ergothioneine biosynthesis protein EgtB